MADHFQVHRTAVEYIISPPLTTRVVTNQGSTLFYKSTSNVTPSSFDGSLTSGQSITISSPIFVVSGGTSSVIASDPLENTAIGPTGATGATGAQGLPDTAPYANVWDLSGTPASVTDWGTLINTAISAGVKHFVFQRKNGARTRYPFSTQIDLRGTFGIVFEGEAGVTHPTTATASGPAVGLLWKGGAGTGPALLLGGNGTGTDGFQMRDLGLLYDSATFNGTLLQTGPAAEVQCGTGVLERCSIGGDPQVSISGVIPDTAACLLNLRSAVGWKIDKCTILGGVYGIRGFDANTSSNPDDLVVSNCLFAGFSTSAIVNPGSNWHLLDNVAVYGSFEAGYPWMPSFVASDHTVGNQAASLLCSRNRHWDFFARATHNHIPYKQGLHDNWDFTAENEWFYTFDGTYFQMGGTGAVRIRNTNFGRQLRDDLNLPLIDLGSSAGGATKTLVEVTGHSWSQAATPATAISNIAGHQIVNLEGNHTPTYGAVVSRGARERLHYNRGPSDVPYPSLVARGGVVNLDGGIGGTDLAGMIYLTASGGTLAAGIVADITFAHPTYTDPDSGQGIVSAAGVLRKSFQLVHVSPCELSGLCDADAFWTYGPSAVVTDGTNTGFSIRIKTAMLNGAKLTFAYRTIGY